MKRFAVAIFGALVLSCIALMGCPGKSSTPTSPGGGGSSAPTNTPTETAICNPSYTFGKSAVGGSSSSFSGGNLLMNEFTLSATGNVYRLHADIPTAPSAGASVQMAIYTNNAGAPQSLLAQSAVQAAVQGWETFDIPATVLAAGSYWIGLTSSAATGVPLAYDTGGSTDTKYAGTSPTTGSLPALLSGFSNSNWDFSYYADYCVNGSSPTPIPTITLTFTPTSTPTNTITFTQTPSSCAGIFSFGTNFTGDTTREVDNGTFASSYSLPVTGKVTQLHAYVVTTNGANAQLALYSNGASGPGTLITQSNSLSVNTGWNSFPVPGTALLPPGTYWIAAANPAGGTGPAFSAVDTSGGASASDGASSLSVLPSPFGSPGGNGINLSLYADYCVPIGSPTPLPSPTLTFTKTSTATNTPTNTETPIPACLGSYSAGSNWPRSAHGVFNNYGSMFCSAITMTTGGSVTMLHYLSGAAGGNYLMALYTSSGGAPHSLLTSSNSQAAVSGINSVTVPATIIGPGVYWVVTMPLSGTGVDFYDDAVGPPSNGGYWMNSATPFPATSTGGTDQGYIYSMWADFCVISGTATPVNTVTWTPTATATHTLTPTVTQTPVCSSPSHLGATTQLTPNSFGGGNMLLTSFYLASSATITGLHVYVNNVPSATNAEMAVYTNSGTNTPNTLITHSNSLPITVGWNYFQVPQTAATGPASIWVAIAGDNYGSGLYIDDNGSGATDSYVESFTYGAFPGTLPSGTAWSQHLNVYVDKCP